MNELTEEENDDEAPNGPVVDDAEKPKVEKEGMEQSRNTSGCARAIDVGAEGC